MGTEIMKLRGRTLLMVTANLLMMTYLVMSSNKNKTMKSELSRRRKEKLLRFVPSNPKMLLKTG